MIRSLTFLSLLLLTGNTTLAAVNINITFIQGQVNQLILEQGPDAIGSILATESIPPSISNQINFTYSQDFHFVAQNLPNGWSFQNVDTGTEKIATFYYSGTNPGTSNEIYDLRNPLTLSFSAVTIAGMSLTAPFTLSGDLTQIPSFATLSPGGEYSATVIPEAATAPLFLGLAIVMFTLAMRSQQNTK
jgi:hypothetical protein